MTLNTRQEEFACLLAAGVHYAEAYELVYRKVNGGSAHGLKTHSEVSALVADLTGEPTELEGDPFFTELLEDDEIDAKSIIDKTLWAIEAQEEPVIHCRWTEPRIKIGPKRWATLLKVLAERERVAA